MPGYPSPWTAALGNQAAGFAGDPGMEAGPVGVPSAPVFGGAPASPPAAPPPLVPPPSAPPMGRPPGMPAPAFSKGREMAMLIPALLAGLKDPDALGAAMRGLQKGKDAKLAERETQQQQQDRRAREQIDFYGRMLEQSQQFDDPIAFEQWKRAISPVANYYGIPVDGVLFSDAKKQAKDKRLIQDALDVAVKRHGPEVLDRDDVSIQLADGRTVSMRIARQAVGGGVMDQSGKTVPAQAKSPFTGTSPDELKIAAAARRLGKPVDQMTEAEIQEAVAVGKPAPSSNVNAGSFEDYVARYAKARNKPVDALTDTDLEDARKRYNQSDDKTPQPNTGANDYRSFLMTDKLQQQWDKLNAPVREMRRQYSLMTTGMDRFRGGDKNGGSQAVLVTFQKILDPTSVVRESEYARTTDGQSMLNRIQGYVTRLAQGGANLTDAEMAAMVETAKQMLDHAQTYTAGIRLRMERTAKEFGIAPALIFDDTFIGGGGDTTPPKVGDTKTFPNGKKGRWDGQGWEQVP